MSDDSRVPDGLGGEVMSAWHRFLDVYEPLRPDLYRYCRHLTASPWEAEDLVQEALTRAFMTLGTLFHPPPSPRAWLFRVASNLWIDRLRRTRRLVVGEPPEGVGEPPDPRATREAAGALIGRLAPQERAAVVLKDVFDFSLDEIADALATTRGAVKAALHRGRGKLAAPGDEAPARVPARGVIDAFCAAFNAGDLEALTALLLDAATVEIVGVVTEYGPEAAKDPYTGSLAGTLAPITLDERGGVPPELLAGYHPKSPRAEIRAYRGAPILLFWYDHDDGPFVRTVMTVETAGDRVAVLRNYFFTPDVIAEVCGDLGVPFRVNGYRYWHPR